MRTYLRSATTVVLALSMLALASVAAFAQTPAYETAVNDAVSDAAGTATNVLSAGIPVVLGVAAIWVALKFGKRLLGRI